MSTHLTAEQQRTVVSMVETRLAMRRLFSKYDRGPYGKKRKIGMTVLRKAMKPFSNKAIAREAGIGYSTVSRYVERVRLGLPLQAPARAEPVDWAAVDRDILRRWEIREALRQLDLDVVAQRLGTSKASILRAGERVENDNRRYIGMATFPAEVRQEAIEVRERHRALLRELSTVTEKAICQRYRIGNEAVQRRARQLRNEAPS